MSCAACFLVLDADLGCGQSSSDPTNELTHKRLGTGFKQAVMLLAKEAEGPHSVGQGQGLEGGDALGTVVATLLQAATSSVSLSFKAEIVAHSRATQCTAWSLQMAAAQLGCLEHALRRFATAGTCNFCCQQCTQQGRAPVGSHASLPPKQGSM